MCTVRPHFLTAERAEIAETKNLRILCELGDLRGKQGVFLRSCRVIYTLAA